MHDEELYIPPFIRRLMPNASEEEIKEAAENLRGFVDALYRLHLADQERRRRTDSAIAEVHGRVRESGPELPRA